MDLNKGVKEVFKKIKKNGLLSPQYPWIINLDHYTAQLDNVLIFFHYFSLNGKFIEPKSMCHIDNKEFDPIKDVQLTEDAIYAFNEKLRIDKDQKKS